MVATVTALEDFAAPEVFSFPSLDGRTQLECRVGPWHDHPGDGFALLRVDPDGAALRLWFDRAGRALHAATTLPPVNVAQYTVAINCFGFVVVAVLSGSLAG